MHKKRLRKELKTNGKKENKVVDLNLTMSIIKLNVNDLNTPEIYRLHERARTTYIFSSGNPLQIQMQIH